MKGFEMADLERFVSAQARVYASVVDELSRGRKAGHWIWYIFPQIGGLGSSSMSRFYAIRDLGEASAYLAHPVLGPRLTECTDLVLSAGRALSAIFPYPDDLKFRSSMTLFAETDDPPAVFARAIETLCDGIADDATLAILRRQAVSGHDI